MSEFPYRDLGRLLLLGGVVLVVTGGLLLLLGRRGFHGVPGDIVYRGDRVTIFFPIATSIVLSILLTLIARFFLRK